MEEAKIDTVNMSQENILTQDTSSLSTGSKTRATNDDQNSASRYSERTVFIRNMDPKITRVDILKSLDQMGL